MLPLIGGLSFLSILLGLFYAYTFGVHLPPIGFQSLPASDQGGAAFPVLDALLAGALMIVGMLFGSVYAAVREMSQPVRLGSELSRALHSPHFIRALLAAPVVFCGVYLAAKSQPDRVVAALFAFENGFFCDSILRQRRHGS